MNRVAIAAALALVLVLPAAARAHALGAEAKLKGGRVTVEAFYDNGMDADGARVAVTGPDGKTVAEGKTDGEGRWTFPVPPAGKYRVVVDAGAGHRKTVELTIPESHPPHPSPAPADAAAPPEAVTVSDGPTRSEFTGPMRLVRLAVGLVLIGGATWVSTRAMRSARLRSSP